LRGRLGRDPRESEPRWPEPEGADVSYRLFEYFEESREQCPVCAEWRERGARFCRRCGRPVDARSRPAAAPIAHAPVPLPTPAAGAAATVLSPVVVPARYIPSAPPVTGAATSPPTAIAIGTTTPAGVAVGPGIAPDAASLTGDAAVTGAAVAPAGRGKVAERPSVRGGDVHVVDVNHATIAELSTLRGVGSATAKRIVAARKEKAFATIDSLVERKVVARSVLDGVRDRLSVGPTGA
jgi:competence protein ComEA